MSEKQIWEYAIDGDLEGIKKRVELYGKDIINVEKYNGNGDTALIEASWNGHLPIVQYLISNGANINDKSKYGWTALHCACSPYSSSITDSTAIEIIKILIANGANETIKNNDYNKTPAECADNDTLRNALDQAVRDRINGKLQSYILALSKDPTQELEELQAYTLDNSSAVIPIEELLNCSQCQSAYTDPRLLPCEHTLCLTCVEKIQNSKELKDRVCPVDKAPFPVNLKPKDLPQNLLCASLATLLPQTKSSISGPVVCSNCPGRVSLWCSVCGDLCETCSKTIHSMATFKSHQPISLQEKKRAPIIPKCSTHGNKDMDLYCPQCKVLVCYICEKASHSDHKCILVVEAAKSSKDALKSNLVSFIKKRNTLQQLIVEKREEIKTNEVKKTQLLAEIEKIKKEIERINKVVEGKNKEIDTTIQQFNQSDTIFKTLMKMIEDKSNFDILDQKVFDETKSFVGSVYKAVYKEDMVK